MEGKKSKCITAPRYLQTESSTPGAVVTTAAWATARRMIAPLRPWCPHCPVNTSLGLPAAREMHTHCASQARGDSTVGAMGTMGNWVSF